MRYNPNSRRIGLSWTLVALLLATTFLTLPPVSAQDSLPLEENFNYGDVDGTLVTVSGGVWANHSGGSPYVMYDADTSLSLAGYPSSGIGGSATISGSGSEDVNRRFTPPATGNIYMASLVRFSTAGAGTYFLHLKDTATGFVARVYARNSDGNLQFGFDNTSTAVWSTQNFAFDTIYLVVARYNVQTTDSALYVLDAYSPTEPATPLIADVGNGFTVDGIAIRQSSGGPTGALDGIRIGTTWLEAVGTGLAVTKTAPSLVAPGEDFTYTITATNGAALGLTNLVITDTVPANATFVSASDGGSFDGSVVEWTVPGPVAAGTSVMRTFQVTASETNGVTIVNDDYGAVADEWTTPAMGSPVTTEVWESIPTDIQVIKSGLTIAAPGEVLTYTLVVSNTSATDALGVVLTDTLPSGTVYVSDDIGTPSNPEEGIYVWQLGDLPAGTGATYHLVIQIDAGLTSGAALMNTAEVSTETDESDLDDNSDTWTTTVYQVLPIADARLLASQYVMVEGTVTAEPGIFVDSGTSRKLYMEDDTGGILVYLASGLQPVARGNKVRVAGQIQEYRTETELVPASTNEVLDLGPATPVTPAQVDTGAVDESMEGELLQVSGLIVAKPVAYILHVDDGSGIVEIYRYYNLGLATDPHYIDYTPYEVGDYISATGPSRGYETSGVVYRQILPRGPEDIEELAAANLSIAKDVEPEADVALGGVVTYTITLSNTGSAAATGIDIVDVLPVEVTFGGWVEQSGATETAGTVEWSGDLAATTSLTIVFTATASSNPALAGQTITNFASFTGAGDSGEDSAAFVLRPLFRIYLPVVFNDYTP